VQDDFPTPPSWVPSEVERIARSIWAHALIPSPSSGENVNIGRPHANQSRISSDA
jgi:hypothetical protein